jgi:hypothetical protein
VSTQPQRHAIRRLAIDLDAKIPSAAERAHAVGLRRPDPRGHRAGIAHQDGATRPRDQRRERGFKIGGVAVVVGMIPVEIHDHGDLGRKAVDRAVALVDLSHHPVARAGPRRRRVVGKQSTQHVARRKIRLAQRRNQQGGGRRLAVRAAHCDELPIPHDFGQQLAPTHHGNPPRPRGHAGRMSRSHGR